MEITDTQAKDAVHRFLRELLDEKVASNLRALEKLGPNGDTEKMAALSEEIAKLERKYDLETWMRDDATRFAVQLRFGTHTSKGIHPDSQGNNINFRAPGPLPKGLVGSQSVPDLPLDANRNAAALPLAALFDSLADEARQIRLGDLIQEQHPSLERAFSADPQTSRERAAIFKAALDNAIKTPETHERNKQVLWPLDDAINEDRYQALVPLCPSAFTHVVFQKLNDMRFSDANKEARDSRRKRSAEQQPYISVTNLAVVRLGGANAQNVGRLNARQNGRNYLLPSLPPLFSSPGEFHLSDRQSSLFDMRLARHCRQGLIQLYDVIKVQSNTHKVREGRRAAVDAILHDIFILAAHIQQSNPPGWSSSYALSLAEKYWLDPERAQIDGEDAFSEGRLNSNWQHSIGDQFALWLNERLKKRFRKLAIHIGDAEHLEWQREMEEAIKASQRAGEELFA